MNIDELLEYRRESFIADFWLPRKPCVIRNYVRIATPSADEILAALRPPVTVRATIADETAVRSLEIADPSHVPLVLASARRRGNRAIFFASGLEHTLGPARALVDCHDFGYRWRHLGSRFSLCFPPHAASFGHHADRTDSMLVQSAGHRVWQIWRPEQVPRDYRHAVMSGHHHLTTTFDTPATAVLTLGPGDALYAPAGFGHDGSTPDDGTYSFAMATAWRAPSALELLRALGPIGPETQAEVDARLDDFIELIPDPPPGEDPASWLAERAGRTIATLATVSLGVADVARLLSTMAAT